VRALIGAALVAPWLGLAALWVTTVFAAEVAVVQRDLAFSEREVTLRVGDRLTLVNADDVRHNVFSERGVTFDVVQAPGDSHTVALGAPGELDVQCAIHPRMKLRVRVLAH
jgi:plastocyanin